MDFVRKPALLAGKEFQIGLMDERSRLQGVIGPFPTQMTGRNPVQFVVQCGQDFIQCGLVSGTQAFEELRHRGTHGTKTITL